MQRLSSNQPAVAAYWAAFCSKKVLSVALVLFAVRTHQVPTRKVVRQDGQVASTSFPAGSRIFCRHDGHATTTLPPIESDRDEGEVGIVVPGVSADGCDVVAGCMKGVTGGVERSIASSSR